MVIRFLLFLLLVFSGFTSTGQSEAGKSVTNPDPMAVQVRLPKHGFAESYRNKREFVYTAKPKVPGFWEQLFRYLAQKFKFTYSLSFIAGVIICLVLIACIILLIVKSEIYRIFYSEEETGLETGLKLNIAESVVNYDELLKTEIAQRCYRNAIRLLYLKSLQILRDKKYIRYSKEKTNIDYLYDLPADELKPGFLLITTIFNRVWYGETEIDEVHFQNFNEKFQSFFSLLNVQE